MRETFFPVIFYKQSPGRAAQQKEWKTIWSQQ